jgi:hypothetical protein
VWGRGFLDQALPCGSLPDMDKMVGTTHVRPSFRITATGYVRKKLKNKLGGWIAFVEDGQGNIVIKKAEIKV